MKNIQLTFYEAESFYLKVNISQVNFKCISSPRSNADLCKYYGTLPRETLSRKNSMDAEILMVVACI